MENYNGCPCLRKVGIWMPCLSMHSSIQSMLKDDPEGFIVKLG